MYNIPVPRSGTGWENLLGKTVKRENGKTGNPVSRIAIYLELIKLVLNQRRS